MQPHAAPFWQLYTYYFALLIGLTAFHVDIEQRRVYRCTFMQVYACTMNALVVVAVPFSLWTSLEFLDYLNLNALMKIVNEVNVKQIFFITGLTIIFRWQRERSIYEILTQLLQLERRYFEKCMPRSVKAHCRQYYSNNLLWLKYFSVISQSLWTLYNMFFYLPDKSVISLFYCVYVICIISAVLHMVLHYFLAMWYLWQRFCWLNARLQQILDVLRSLEAHKRCDQRVRKRAYQRLGQELMEVVRVHYQLTGFAERITNCYRFQIITVLFSKVINNISITYLGLKYGNNSFLKSLGVTYHIFSTSFFIITLSDSYLLDILCERVVGASHEAAEVLKRFDELFELDDAVEYACSIFSQHLRQHKLKINIFGMMNVNKRLSFLVFGGFVKNVLLLLQWDLAKQFEV